jgi:dihydroxy-acid dehydratase
MLYAIDFNNDNFKKPQIGIDSTGGMVASCSMHINHLSDDAKGVNQAHGKSLMFNCISISNGISMGTESMKYSLV